MILALEQVHFGYSPTTPVITEASFSVHDGESIAIMGPSGCGKTTLIKLLTGMLRPQRGQIVLRGSDVTQYSRKQWAQIRREQVGLIFQDAELLPELSAIDNICLPAYFGKHDQKALRSKAMQLMEQFSLPLRSDITQYSGGERQRLAICRALIQDPTLVIADEPTASLDTDNAALVTSALLALLHDEQRQSALIVITHDHTLADAMDSKYELIKGQLSPVQRVAS